MYRDSAREKLLYCSDLSFYKTSTDTNQLLAPIKLLLCCAVNMFVTQAKGRPDGARRRVSSELVVFITIT